MDQPERQTRSHLMRLFERHGYHPRTNLGQNFLIDLNIIEFVVRSAELTRDDVVLEIGAGTGGMTTFMAHEAGHVISVELDRNMYGLATEAIAPYQNVTLINADGLKNKNHFNPLVLEEVERQLAVSPDRRLKLVANLPYSVATPIMTNLVASEYPWVRMVVTIQYEVGVRMQAQTGAENYGALSLWLQSQCHVDLVKKLPPSVFWPRPKVDSAVMVVTPDPEGRSRLGNREFFHDYIRRVFNYRRKLLRSVLSGMYGEQLDKPEIDQILSGLGLSESARAEELEMDTHIELARRLLAAQENKNHSSPAN